MMDGQRDRTFQEGRMTSEQFLQACSEFADLPQAKNDLWTLQRVPELGDEVIYLTRTSFQAVQLPIHTTSHDPVTTNRKTIVQCRYDVLYSLAHCVPVLYFMIYDASGNPIFQIEDVWQMWNVEGVKTSSSNSAWNILSLQDHPVSNTPFYFVHPCNTCNILKDCQEVGNNNSSCLKYLISWMSIVGNQFGLNVSNSYFK